MTSWITSLLVLAVAASAHAQGKPAQGKSVLVGHGRLEVWVNADLAAGYAKGIQLWEAPGERCRRPARQARWR
jgi:hypothetical protein